jgi:hypothetical protein
MRMPITSRPSREKVIADLEDVPPGGRNDTLNHVAWKLGRWIAAGALEQAGVEDALYAAVKANGLVADDGERQCWPRSAAGSAPGCSSPSTWRPTTAHLPGSADAQAVRVQGGPDRGQGTGPATHVLARLGTGLVTRPASAECGMPYQDQRAMLEAKEGPGHGLFRATRARALCAGPADHPLARLIPGGHAACPLSRLRLLVARCRHLLGRHRWRKRTAPARGVMVGGCSRPSRERACGGRALTLAPLTV